VASGFRLRATRFGETRRSLAEAVSRKAAKEACAPSGAASRSSEPPVLVDPRQALALERLRVLMTQGRLDGKMLPAPVTPEAALADLTIAPLEIDEIQVPGVEIVGQPPAAPQRQ
jgi:hypothetical protein